MRVTIPFTSWRVSLAFERLQHKRRPGVRGLMLLVAIIACAIGAYRHYVRFVRQVTVVYPVAGLVVSSPASGPRAVDLDPLVNALQSQVMPSSWKGQRGTGTIEPVYLNLSLRITQCEAAQEEIAEYLGELDSRRKRVGY